MLRNWNHGIALLPLMIAAMAGVGCQGGEEPEGLAGIEAAPESDEAAAILAEIKVGERATVRFVDESVSVPEGGVGVLMIGAPQLSAGYRELDLTPLELYLAIAPGADVPELLREDHRAAVEARGLASAAPRRISVDPGTLTLREGPSHALPPTTNAQSTAAFDCTTYAGDTPIFWADTWCSATASGSSSCTTQFGLTGNTYIYSGSGGERWLGACNDSNISNATLAWRVDVQISASTWVAVTGTSITLSKDHAVNYHSTGGISNYRAQILAGSTVVYQTGTAHD